MVNCKDSGNTTLLRSSCYGLVSIERLQGYDIIYCNLLSGSINLIIVPVGCAVSGIVTSPLGRRRAMQMVNIPFFIAWLILHFSTTTGHLYGALFITGLAGGLLEAPVSFLFVHTCIVSHKTDHQS